MRFYSIGLPEILKLRTWTFWELSKNVDRIRAEEGKRLLALLCQVMNPKAKEYFEKLDKEQGRIYVVEGPSDFDRSGMQNLKRLMGT